MKYYLAYGSNLNIFQMLSRCPGARLVGVTNLNGYSLVFKGSKTGSYLTIQEEEGGKVPVAVYRITKKDEKALDRYEGFPSFYYKKSFSVPGLKEDAFLYIMKEDRPYGIPTQHYYEVCREGYQDFCFDEEFLKEALRKSKEALENV